eukprot:TRINITY_DN14954_c0_g1_i1.p1 TRINITY_DN14954_c0_g1~~TRINITY_DN14954_c0_g1_i1.p1  ORF type:complete len:425 (+),score=90.34 TRINITY_DN14954_c0_g1_i1:84-1277(+)
MAATGRKRAAGDTQQRVKRRAAAEARSLQELARLREGPQLLNEVGFFRLLADEGRRAGISAEAMRAARYYWHSRMQEVCLSTPGKRRATGTPAPQKPEGKSSAAAGKGSQGSNAAGKGSQGSNAGEPAKMLGAMVSAEASWLFTAVCMLPIPEAARSPWLPVCGYSLINDVRPSCLVLSCISIAMKSHGASARYPMMYQTWLKVAILKQWAPDSEVARLILADAEEGFSVEKCDQCERAILQYVYGAGIRRPTCMVMLSVLLRRLATSLQWTDGTEPEWALRAVSLCHRLIQIETTAYLPGAALAVAAVQVAREDTGAADNAEAVKTAMGLLGAKEQQVKSAVDALYWAQTVTANDMADAVAAVLQGAHRCNVQEISREAAVSDSETDSGIEIVDGP